MNHYIALFLLFSITAIPALNSQDIVIRRTPVAPVLDGIADVLWTGVDPVSIQYVFIASSIEPEDLSATIRTVWDDDFLYILYEVTDDVYKVDSLAGWQDDSVQIYLDADNAKNTTYDANDAELYMSRNDSRDLDGLINTAFGGNVYWKVSERPGGYTAEVAVAWEGFQFTPAAGRQFGIDFQVNDDDGGDPDAVMKWFDATGTGNRNPSVFATAELSDEEIVPVADVVFRRTENVPVLDGEIDTVWLGVPAWPLEQVYVASEPLDPANLSATVKAMWDEENLYFLFEVTDDHFSDDSPDAWQDDSVQIYLDADNSKGTVYDANDDFVMLRRNDDKPAEGDATKPYVASISWVVREVEGGYIAEVMLPWSALAQTPEHGLMIGVDFQVNDDDTDDGMPEVAIKLFDAVGSGNVNPSLMGTAILSSHRVVPPIIGPEVFLGYTTRDNWINTGSWMGRLYVGLAPNVWSEAIGGWMWIEEDSDSPDGIWVFFY